MADATQPAPEEVKFNIARLSTREGRIVMRLAKLLQEPESMADANDELWALMAKATDTAIDEMPITSTSVLVKRFFDAYGEAMNPKAPSTHTEKVAASPTT